MFRRNLDKFANFNGDLLNHQLEMYRTLTGAGNDEQRTWSRKELTVAVRSIGMDVEFLGFDVKQNDRITFTPNEMWLEGLHSMLERKNKKRE